MLNTKRNRWFFCFTVALFIYPMMIHAWAQNDIQVLIDNKTVNFDQPPIIKNGRTLVPMRAIFEAFDLEVIWNATERSVRASKEPLVIDLKIDDLKAMVNGEEHTLDVPATIVGNRTMVPIRFIGESLGARVSWIEKSRTVVIEKLSSAQPRLEGNPSDRVFSVPDQEEVTIEDLNEDMYLNPIELAAKGNITETINPEFTKKDIHATEISTQGNTQSQSPIASNEVNTSNTAVVGSLKFSTGIYTGAIMDGAANGEGVLVRDNGDQYEGGFRNNRFHGYGEYTWMNLNRTYSGYWEDGAINGQGIMTYKTGDRYNGAWKDAKRNGTGTYTWANGDIYEGEWENDKKHGQGKMTTGEIIFEGEWEENEFKGSVFYEGYETIDLEDGSRYEGNLEDGQASGLGRMTYSNGDDYEGNWKNGQMHGQGKMTFNNGDVYEGNWENGQINGQGKMTFNNGDYYEGAWKNGLRVGMGTYIYADEQIKGYVYVGGWENDLKNGLGKFYDANGSIIYDGQWKDSKRHGRGTLYFSSGEVYVGAWENDMMHGQGIIAFNDGDIYEGVWENDAYKKGKYQWKNPNGKDEEYTGEFMDNKPHGKGTFKFFYKSNEIQVRANFENGSPKDEVTILINNDRKTIDLNNVEEDDKEVLDLLKAFSSKMKVKKTSENNKK